jgi:ATP-dependent helicase/nuclease subunit A
VNTLKIYKSSAGSGKTFTLVVEYLKLVVKNPDDFRTVLAITFTNKAAEEMKSRIISSLVELSNGSGGAIQKILNDELPGTNLTINSGKALKNILHDYSSFSVSTIDSFFQRILRSLARELNLPLKMEVEVGLDDAILAVTEKLLSEVGKDKDLTDWLTRFTLQKIDEDKGWNIEKDIGSVGYELFREERHNEKTLSREEIHELYDRLQNLKKNFEKKMQEYGKSAIEKMRDGGYNVVDFSYGKSGVANYFFKIRDSKDPEAYKIKGRVSEALESADKWSSKTNSRRKEIISFAEAVLLPKLKDAAAFSEMNYTAYITAGEILKKLFLFGIVNDLSKKFSEYRNENNLILLSDTSRLLSDMIGESDAPFLYEKTGNRYHHLLIDEFQDTSLLQWKNLLPLVVNALGSGYMTMVVGDAKQSIYRWRGGNMNLLLTGILQDLKNFKSIFKEEVLSFNYRSKKEIVEFNNDFFTSLPEVVKLNNTIINPSFKLAYTSELEQKYAAKNDTGGFVRIELLASEEKDEEESLTWKDSAMEKMLADIESLIKDGYAFRDIAILVRKNKEGNEIANYLLGKGIEKIISPDSLLITSSPVVNFLINVFTFLADRKNSVARTEVMYYYLRYIANNESISSHSIFSDHRNYNKKKKNSSSGETLFETEALEENNFNKLLPTAFVSKLSMLSRLPVYELSEQIISIFSLNTIPDAYIQRFQDLVLEYHTRFNSSLDGFLKWWNSSKTVRDCSVIIPENENAIRIMTIHRSKGLQFPVVIIPFAEWKLLPKPNSTLWLGSSEPPYSETGKFALSCSSKLSDSYFKEEYEEELGHTLIDNINLLYVAFTRAEQKLFVYAPVDKGKELNSSSKLIARTCASVKGVAENIYERGTNIFTSVKKTPDDVQSETLKNYMSNRWQDKLALTTHSADLIGLNEKADRINYGLLIHKILAEIKVPAEAEMVIGRFVFEGLIDSHEKEELKKEISEVLNNENIGKFFSNDFKVMSERDILLPGGEVLRPDRVLFNNDEIILIDFKTGQSQAKHETQIKRYAEVLSTMKKNRISAFLIYLNNRQVTEVDLSAGAYASEI